jgi:hypothetical protein
LGLSIAKIASRPVRHALLTFDDWVADLYEYFIGGGADIFDVEFGKEDTRDEGGVVHDLLGCNDGWDEGVAVGNALGCKDSDGSFKREQTDASHDMDVAVGQSEHVEATSVSENDSGEQ